MQSRNIYKNIGILAIIVGIVVSVLVVALTSPQASAKETSVDQTEIVGTINMWITGDSQGDFEGSSTRAGLEGTIDVFGFSHLINVPRDASTGMATGRRVHTPLRVVKEIDKSTPLLYQALINNENLDVTIKWYRISIIDGQEENYFAIELMNAAIASIQDYSAGTSHAPMEQVSFVYQSISWTWVDSGLSATDDWVEPVG